MLQFGSGAANIPVWYFKWSGTLQVMCLNGWGGKLYDELLPYLASAHPDVLCLQEVVHTPLSKKTWLTYRDGDHILPQRANFFNDVCKTLPDHVAIFCPAAQGVLWDVDTAIPSQWGLATFIHKSFPIIGQVQSFVHKSYSPSGYGDHPRSRSAHGVRLYDYQKDCSVSITHMHGLRDLAGKSDTLERAVQAQRLLDISRQIASLDDLSVICGDFNVEPDSETLKILARAGFTELVSSHGYNGTRTSYYQKPGKFADYMLINREAEVQEFQVVCDPEVSDHCPLVLYL